MVYLGMAAWEGLASAPPEAQPTWAQQLLPFSVVRIVSLSQQTLTTYAVRDLWYSFV
jgi:hypothetical protein